MNGSEWAIRLITLPTFDQMLKTLFVLHCNGLNQALHTVDLKVISPLFSTELNINMSLIKLILANQPTNLEIG